MGSAARWGALAAAGSLLMGCAKDNPLFGLTDGDGGTSDSSASSSIGSTTSTTLETSPGPTTTEATTTGGPSATTGGSSSTSSGLPSIVDRGVLVRYYLDEGRGGGMPGLALDATDMPLDLNLDYGGGNMGYAMGPGGWGLRWQDPGEDGGACRPIDGSQFVTRLAGSTVATIELVIEPEAVVSLFSRYIHVGDLEQDGVFTLSTDSVDEVSLAMDDNAPSSPEARFVVDVASQRAVWHLVFDGDEPTQANRARLYVDGQRQPSTFDAVASGQAVDMLTGDRELCLGNRAPPEARRSFQGALYYAAVYDTALSLAEIDNNVEVLLADDDSPVGF